MKTAPLSKRQFPLARPWLAAEAAVMDLIAAALANPTNRKILERLPMLGLPQACLVAGCIWQAWLNLRDGRKPADQVNDYDIFYFDAADLSFEAEDRVIRQAAALFQDIDGLVEIRNQARIHLWYPDRFGCACPPMASTSDAIRRFPVLGMCIGVTAGQDGSLRLIAPYGVDDLEAGLLRPNPACVDPTAFARKAASYQARWPWLRIVDGDHA